MLSHNDCQENNILTSLSDATQISLIDFEYGMWNPQYYDIAVYLNEFAMDNAYPCGSGIAVYLENFPDNHEIESLVRQYFELTQSRHPDQQIEWSMENLECQEVVK